MGTERVLARKPALVERRPPAPAASLASRAVAAGPTSAQLLQRCLGCQGAAALVARTALRVSSPHDQAEREATAKAAEVMRMASPSSWPGAHAEAGHAQRCECQTQGRGATAGTTLGPDVAADIQRSSAAGGAALPHAISGFMEPRFGADFSSVRIHTDQRAGQLSERLDARAFTVGNHVFFGPGQYQPDTHAGKELIAHELTHTIQQGGAARRAAPSAGGIVQRDEKQSWWDRLTDWGESLAWDMVREIAPSFVPILQKGPGGVLDWIGEQVGAAVDRVFNSLLAPVRAITGVGETVSALLTPVLTGLQVAAVKIAHNDCSPIREAAEKLEKAAERIVTPIIETLQPVVARVKEFLSGLWDKFGAPIWEWIKSYAQQQWEQIKWLADMAQKFFSWIWEKTAWIRSVAAKAWTWVKNKLGIGEGVEGQNGLLQWVQGKLEAAWAALKAKLEPFKKELTAIGGAVLGVALALSPAGPVLAIGAAVAGAIQGIRWIAAHWGKGNAIVQARAYLEKSLIPSLLGAAHRLSAAVTRMAESLSGALGMLAAGMTRAVGSLAGSVLRFAVSAVQWLADQAVALANWAGRQLGQLCQWLTGALDQLKALLKRMLGLLERLGGVLLDIWSLPLMLGEKVWNAIPACIRDPIVDFLGPIILRQIELFEELARDNEAWQKTKADVMNIIRLVFKNHDLVGAVKATFHLILRVFNVPPELLVKIVQKAMAAWDVVSKKPLDFIKSTVRAVGHGFKLLKDNILAHLQFGVEGWLFGELAEKNIARPASWSDPKAVFGFVLDVLGLSVAHVIELLEKRIQPPEKVDAVVKRIGQVAGALAWIDKAIDTTKSPAENARALVDRGKEFGKDVLTGVAEWVAGKVAEELAIMAAAAAASGGLSEVLDVARRVYKVLLSVKRYLARILQMISDTLDNVLDLAGNKWEAVGAKLEAILHRGMPVVIGFLAEQVGLGGVGAALRTIVDKLREKVDAALLWVIDKLKAALEALVGLVQKGIKALLQWWKKEVPLEAAGERHTIRFEGSEGSARLVIASKPKPVVEFVRAFLTVEGTAQQIANANQMDAKITVTQKLLVAAEAKGDEAEMAKLLTRLDNELAVLAKILISLMDLQSDEGSTKRPLLIDYPKRRAEAYPPIFIGPRVGDGPRVNQDWLRSLATEPPQTAKKRLAEKQPALTGNPGYMAWGGQIRRLSPTTQVPVDDKTVGLSPEFGSIGPGQVLVYTVKEGTGGGHKINDCFRPYGFVPASKGGEGMDGDHVMERQIGGPDELRNLWPLPASENRSSGSKVKSLQVTYAGEPMTVHEARTKRKKEALFLLIRSVRSE
jgi:hypothetical protein